MSHTVKPIPEGFRTLTPAIVCRGAADAITFYQKAFGAEVLTRMEGPGGTIMHAELRIGDSIFMLSDEFIEYGAVGPSENGSPVTLCLYVADCDAVFQQAIDAGATAKMPPADQFWGDRYGKLADPFGHSWSVATHIKDMTDEEVAAAAAEAMSAGGAQ